MCPPLLQGPWAASYPWRHTAVSRCSSSWGRLRDDASGSWPACSTSVSFILHFPQEEWLVLRHVCLTCSRRDIQLRTHTQTLTSTSLVKFLHLFFWPENTNQKLLMVDIFMGFTRSSAVKNPPAMQETQVWTLGWGDPLQKEITTYSSIFVWEIPWTEEPGGLQSMGSQRERHDLVTKQDQNIFIEMLPG